MLTSEVRALAETAKDNVAVFAKWTLTKVVLIKEQHERVEITRINTIHKCYLADVVFENEKHVIPPIFKRISQTEVGSEEKEAAEASHSHAISFTPYFDNELIMEDQQVKQLVFNASNPNLKPYVNCLIDAKKTLIELYNQQLNPSDCAVFCRSSNTDVSKDLAVIAKSAVICYLLLLISEICSKFNGSTDDVIYLGKLSVFVRLLSQDKHPDLLPVFILLKTATEKLRQHSILHTFDISTNRLHLDSANLVDSMMITLEGFAIPDLQVGFFPLARMNGFPRAEQNVSNTKFKEMIEACKRYRCDANEIKTLEKILNEDCLVEADTIQEIDIRFSNLFNLIIRLISVQYFFKNAWENQIPLVKSFQDNFGYLAEPFDQLEVLAAQITDYKISLLEYMIHKNSLALHRNMTFTAAQEILFDRLECELTLVQEKIAEQLYLQVVRYRSYQTHRFTTSETIHPVVSDVRKMANDMDILYKLKAKAAAKPQAELKNDDNLNMTGARVSVTTVGNFKPKPVKWVVDAYSDVDNKKKCTIL
ncbi:MAG: hypothetical protein ABI597_03575 [Gammaproteobacteria bacterium]